MKMKFILLGIISLFAYCQSSLLITSPVEKLSKEYNWQATQRDAVVKDVREAIFTQWADHTDHADGATFDQYVFINDEYYQPGGPVFILVSATPDSYTYWLQNSHMTNIASELGGVVYAIEPRFFGRSYPTSDLSLENLEKYLHVNQTMADYFNFITYLRSELANYGSDKFVLIGHGRGGTLATWIHQRYPGIANGVWAASSPVVTLFDFGLYYYGIGTTFETEFPATCQQTIIEAFTELEAVINNEDIGTLRDIFIFDSELDLSNQHDVALFYRQLFELLFSPVEYGTSLTINLICNAFAPYEGYSSLQLLGSFYGSALNNQIFKYDDLVSLLKEESLEAEAVLLYQRQELYVRCAGWSLFKISSLLPVPINLRFPGDIFADICNDVFGISYNDVLENNFRTNSENQFDYNIQNVYFTNAEFDPHHLIGVQHDVSSTIAANLIPRVGKLADFSRYVYSDASSDELHAARDRAAELITLWTSPNV
jgi:pimeloyl-ACP methyl ester carboxylesterase